MNLNTAQHAANAGTRPAATREGSRPPNAEQRLKELGIQIPAPLEPFGIYAEAVQTGNLLFLTGTLPKILKIPCRTQNCT